MSKKYHVRERAFLNLKTDMRAYIIAVVEDTREIPNSNEDQWKWGRIELKMADCHDDISLEFDLAALLASFAYRFFVRQTDSFVDAGSKSIWRSVAKSG